MSICLANFIFFYLIFSHISQPTSEIPKGDFASEMNGEKKEEKKATRKKNSRILHVHTRRKSPSLPSYPRHLAAHKNTLTLVLATPMSKCEGIKMFFSILKKRRKKLGKNWKSSPSFASLYTSFSADWTPRRPVCDLLCMYVRKVDGQRCVVVHIMAKSLGEGKGMEKTEGNLFVSHRGFSIIVALVRSRQIRSIIQFHSSCFSSTIWRCQRTEKAIAIEKVNKKLHTTRNERGSEFVNKICSHSAVHYTLSTWTAFAAAMEMENP